MTVVSVNGSQQRTDGRRIRDCGPMLHLRRGKCPPEIGRRVPLRATSRNGVSKYLATCASEATRRFVAPPRFDTTQGAQEFGRTDFSERPLSDNGIGQFKKPLCLVECRLGSAFAPELVEPFVSYGPECIFVCNLRGDLVELPLGGRICAASNLLFSFVFFRARFGKRDRRIDAKGQSASLPKPAIIHPPVAGAIGSDEQIQPSAVRELVGRFPRFRCPNGQISQRHDGISSLTVHGGTVTCTVRIAGCQWIDVDYVGQIGLLFKEIAKRKDCAGLGWTVNGAQGRNRTSDTAIFNRMLYQLSYLGAE